MNEPAGGRISPQRFPDTLIATRAEKYASRLK